MIRVRKDESPSFFVQKQKRSIENCAKYTKIESKNHDFIQKIKFYENKLTKFRFMTIIKIQNKISHETKVKK